MKWICVKSYVVPSHRDISRNNRILVFTKIKFTLKNIAGHLVMMKKPMCGIKALEILENWHCLGSHLRTPVF